MYNTAKIFTLVRPQLEQQHVRTKIGGGRTQGAQNTAAKGTTNTLRTDTLQHDSWGPLITPVPCTNMQRAPPSNSTVLSEALYTQQTKDTQNALPRAFVPIVDLFTYIVSLKDAKKRRRETPLPTVKTPHATHLHSRDSLHYRRLPVRHVPDGSDVDGRLATDDLWRQWGQL